MARKRYKTADIRVIQGEMLNSVQDCFSDDEQDSLRGLIRVTIRSYESSQAGGWDSLQPEASRYLAETILACLRSFFGVNNAYNVLRDTAHSTMKWRELPLGGVEDCFAAMFADFMKETQFEQKCRLLLNLTKLQLNWAVAFYCNKGVNQAFFEGVTSRAGRGQST